ncbi:MAG TPA: type II 3-dehydroquinate dehydratase [Polyangiaceae bacterium]
MATRKITSPKSAAPLRVLVLSGPNLDRLGRREPEIYGRTTLAEIHSGLEAFARGRGVDVDCRQTNHEGLLVDWIGAAADDGFNGILLNAGAYTHTSYALHDAIKGAGLPTIEVHVSNPEAREAFRHVSRIAPACRAKVAGFGPLSYGVALEGLLGLLVKPKAHRALPR